MITPTKAALGLTATAFSVSAAGSTQMAPELSVDSNNRDVTAGAKLGIGYFGVVMSGLGAFGGGLIAIEGARAVARGSGVGAVATMVGMAVAAGGGMFGGQVLGAVLRE